MEIAEGDDYSYLDEDIKEKLFNSLQQLKLRYESDKTQFINQAFKEQEIRKSLSTTSTIPEKSSAGDQMSVEPEEQNNCYLEVQEHQPVTLDTCQTACHLIKDGLDDVVPEKRDSQAHCGELLKYVKQNRVSDTEISVSPVLSRKSNFKKRKHNRSIFPKITRNSLNLLTNDESADFKLPESYFVNNSDETTVVNADGTDSNHIKDACDDHMDLVEVDLRETACSQSVESKVLFDKDTKMSMMIGQNVSFFALYDANTDCTKIFVKKEREWKEKWKLTSETTVDELRWMIDSTTASVAHLLIINYKLAIIRMSRFDIDMVGWSTNVCQIGVPGLSSLAILPQMKLVTNGDKIIKYAFDQQTKDFRKETTLMPVQEQIVAIAAVRHQQNALLGSSSVHLYLWNSASGNLLQQISLQSTNVDVSRLSHVASLKGVLALHVLGDSPSSCACIVTNPWSGKCVLVSKRQCRPTKELVICWIADTLVGHETFIHDARRIAEQCPLLCNASSSCHDCCFCNTDSWSQSCAI